jgi:hypothetical protein
MYIHVFSIHIGAAQLLTYQAARNYAEIFMYLCIHIYTSSCKCYMYIYIYVYIYMHI